MEHNRIKLISAAVFTALLLTGCGKAKVPDFDKDYKEYLDYAFDGNYSISKPMEQRFDVEDRTEYTWQVVYTANDGEDRTTKMVLNRGDSENKKYIAYTNDRMVADLVEEAQSREICEEIADQILSKYFKESANTNNMLSLNGDEFSIHAQLINCRLMGMDPDRVSEFITPGSGGKYVGTNLADWACDKYSYIKVNFDIFDETKTEELTEKFNNIFSDYTALTKDPQTYCFILKKQNSDQNWETLATECKVQGKDFDADNFSIRAVAAELGIDTDAYIDPE